MNIQLSPEEFAEFEKHELYQAGLLRGVQMMLDHAKQKKMAEILASRKPMIPQTPEKTVQYNTVQEKEPDESQPAADGPTVAATAETTGG